MPRAGAPDATCDVPGAPGSARRVRRASHGAARTGHLVEVADVLGDVVREVHRVLPYVSLD